MKFIKKFIYLFFTGHETEKIGKFSTFQLGDLCICLQISHALDMFAACHVISSRRIQVTRTYSFLLSVYIYIIILY